METAREQRAEKRLRYRWHARFALSAKQKPLSGQMVDVSSKGMAFLYHNDKNCPGPNQLITTNFGVPHFDSGGSFDTVFFNRIGRICRIDNLTSKVNRIAIQFAEPLFFKPGEQNISDFEAKQRLEAKAQLIANAKKSTSLYSEKLARAEEKAKAETKARAKAEMKAKSEARLRAKAEKKAEIEAEKRAKIEAELREKADLHAELLAKFKTKAAQEIAKIKAEYKPKLHQKKTRRKKNTRDKTKKSGEGILLDKVDKFITNRNRIF